MAGGGRLGGGPDKAGTTAWGLEFRQGPHSLENMNDSVCPSPFTGGCPGPAYATQTSGNPHSLRGSYQ